MAALDVTGVPLNIAEHKLKAYPSGEPVRQKKRRMAPKRSKAVREKIEKLIKADILKEVRYQTWITNPVMVTKSEESGRMCIDFKDINKACPKDNYPLPENDRKINSLMGDNVFMRQL